MEGGRMTDIGEMPEEWEVVRLGDVCAKMKSGGTPLTSKKEFYGGNIKFVKIEDLSKLLRAKALSVCCGLGLV